MAKKKMTLLDVLRTVKYYQKLYIVVINQYGQNVCIAKGRLHEFLCDEETAFDLLDHYDDKVDMITPAKDGCFVVRIKDEHFHEPLEKQYNESYVNKWDINDKNSRPFLFDTEMPDWILDDCKEGEAK